MDEQGRVATTDDRGLRRILREELTLARVEARDEVARTMRGLAAVTISILLLYIAVVFVVLMLVYILGALLEPWIGAAIVGGTLTVVALLALRAAWRYFLRVRD